MSPTTGNAANLSALAISVASRKGGARLANTIKNASRAQSCVSDLSLAQNSLEALSQLQNANWNAKPVHRMAVEHSLLANAIILYARATAVGAKRGERGHTSVRDRMDTAHQADHDEIIEVRHLAVAHVRPNQKLSGDLWHRDLVFAVELEDGGWLPAAVTRRVQVHGRMEQRLRRLLPIAESLIKETYHKRLNEIVQQLEQMPDAQELLTDHPLDKIEMFGSAEEAERALGNPGKGRSEGIINLPGRDSPDTTTED